MGTYRMSDGRHIECWFSISVGRWDRESLQQDRKHCQFASWVRRVFFSLPFFNFSFPFFLKSLISPCGDTKDATRKATEPPFAFLKGLISFGPNLNAWGVVRGEHKGREMMS